MGFLAYDSKFNEQNSFAKSDLDEIVQLQQHFNISCKLLNCRCQNMLVVKVFNPSHVCGIGRHCWLLLRCCLTFWQRKRKDYTGVCLESSKHQTSSLSIQSAAFAQEDSKQYLCQHQTPLSIKPISTLASVVW